MNKMLRSNFWIS